jgi:hypothetical protein
MITELRHVLSALIARIADKLIELDKLSKVDASHVLGEPASMEEIEAFVAGVGLKPPEDYNVFLLLFNGWQDFNGENSPLSIEETIDGPIHEHIATFQKDLRSSGLEDVGSGLVFEAPFGTRISTSIPLGWRPPANSKSFSGIGGRWSAVALSLTIWRTTRRCSTNLLRMSARRCVDAQSPPRVDRHDNRNRYATCFFLTWANALCP